MYSIKKLEDAAKEVLKDLRDVESREKSMKSNVDILESKRTSIAKEVELLEQKKTGLLASIEAENKNILDSLAKREDDFRKKENEFNQRMVLGQKEIGEASSARDSMLKSKAYYDEKYKEYEEKLTHLQEKENRLSIAIHG